MTDAPAPSDPAAGDPASVGGASSAPLVPSAPSARPSLAIVLAAGEGTRMRSATPKVMHEVAGRSLLGHVLAAVDATRAHRTVVVVGHGREAVTAHVASLAPDARCVVQEQQHGTGHAVAVALDALAADGILPAEADGPVLVLAGDTPLLQGDTLSALVAGHAAHAAVTVLTAVVPDPTGYGRIVRDASGAVVAVVEHRDADDAVRAITEINSGVWLFSPDALSAGLAALTTDNAQGEHYLTDVLAHARAAGGRVGAVIAADHVDILGVNDRVQLAEAASLLRDRLVRSAMRAGVTVVDPATTWLDVDVRLQRDVRLEPSTQLLGRTEIAAGAVIGPDTTLRDCRVGEAATVRRTDATGAVIGARATVGPFTFLRPGTVLGAGAKAGAYVEIKASTVGDDSKVPHLSYVGDADIGRDSNIGAATVTVNYDGSAKHRTVIGDAVRIGSDTMLVAPVTIGDGAYTAAGSVITDDVPPGAMAVGRARQRNVHGWVARRRPGTASAAAAARAGQGSAEHAPAATDATGDTA